MAIGEFGGAAALPASDSFIPSTPMYWLYELGHAALNPSRVAADATKLFFKNPANPLSHTMYGRTMAAAAEMFERSTRRYKKPSWDIDTVLVE
ncbi:MAG: polyhydroxyalkanoate depolymerase, partial [Pseudolabrys sp.]